MYVTTSHPTPWHQDTNKLSPWSTESLSSFTLILPPSGNLESESKGYFARVYLFLCFVFPPHIVKSSRICIFLLTPFSIIPPVPLILLWTRKFHFFNSWIMFHFDMYHYLYPFTCPCFPKSVLWGIFVFSLEKCLLKSSIHLISLSVIELYELFIYLGYYVLVGCMVYKDFTWCSRIPFHFTDFLSPCKTILAWCSPIYLSLLLFPFSLELNYQISLRLMSCSVLSMSSTM